jgi:alpha-1,2-mannosyltransferase
VFCVDAPYTRVLEYLATSLVGLHTMTREHFGIGIVEYMAAGMIPVAHKSGGPLMDIVTRPGKNGFLCETVDEYVRDLAFCFSDNHDYIAELQAGARDASNAFSEQVFDRSFLDTFSKVMN